MKKQLIALAITACSANIALADTSGFYLGGQLGSSLLRTETTLSEHGDFKILFTSNKSVLGGSINTGYNFNSQYDLPIRTELSYTMRDNKKIKGTLRNGLTLKSKLTLDTLMFNTYYDIYTNSNFTPYVTLGMGAAFVKNNSTIEDEPTSFNKTKFAYSVGLGVSYKITDQWSADIMSRSTFAGKIKNEDEKENSTKIESHDLMVGILYNF